MHRRTRTALAVRLMLAATLCVLIFGGIPGTGLRGVVLVLTAPPLPAEVKDREGSLEVSVIAAASREAISGARVTAFAILDNHAYQSATAIADARGVASLKQLPLAEHWIVAEAPLYARGSSRLVVTREPRALEMALAEEHRLAMSVRDEQGNPVPGAEIEITSGVDALPIGARAGSDGAADVTRLGKGPWIVTVRAPGYEQTVQRGVVEGESPIITLRRLGALLVKVVHEDRPVAGARVQISGASLWPARSADTDASGSVRIGALQAGSYALRATQGDLVSPIEIGVMLGRGEEKTIVLKLVQGRWVKVKVTEGEADDADVVPGARLTLVEGGISPFPIEAVSGKDGRARLGPIAPGSATLSARAEGYVPRGSMLVVGEGEMIVPLAKAGVLVGRVVDRRGDAIDGATIEIIGTDFYGAPVADDPRRLQFREAHFEAMLPGPRPLIPAGELGVMPGPVPPIPRVGGFSTPDRVTRPIAEDPWVTKRDGTFRCAPATPGRIRALVRHPQYVEAVSDVVTLNAGAEATVTVTMSAGGALEGRVLDHRGTAVSGARVSIAATRGTLERSARTASDGTFAFASVPDSITVSVGAEDDPTQIAARVLVQVPDGGKKEITINLPAPREPVEVRVRDDRGYPVDAAQITAHSLDPDSPLRVTSFTNGRGEARLSSARGLHVRVEVNAPGQAPKILTLEAMPATLDVTLDEAESASGEVRSTRGDRLESAEVVLYTSAGARHARTIADGTFTVKDLPPGPARLRVRAKGFAPVEKDVEVPASRGKRTHDLRRIELAPEGIVEGLVVDERGDPVQGARVAKDRVPTYLAVGGTPPGVAVTDARGRFKLGELPEGIITLEAFMPDVGRVRHEAVRVTAGRSTIDVRITLKKEGKGYDPASAGGVAITLGESQGEVVIAQVAESSEAERAGLQPGDVIDDVDGVKVKTIEEARAKLNGPLGDDVVLRVKRSDKHETVRVSREPVRR